MWKSGSNFEWDIEMIEKFILAYYSDWYVNFPRTARLQAVKG